MSNWPTSAGTPRIYVRCTHCEQAIAYTLAFGAPRPTFPGADLCFHCAAGEPFACAKRVGCDCRIATIEAAEQAYLDNLDPSDFIWD